MKGELDMTMFLLMTAILLTLILVSYESYLYGRFVERQKNEKMKQREEERQKVKFLMARRGFN